MNNRLVWSVLTTVALSMVTIATVSHSNRTAVMRSGVYCIPLRLSLNDYHTKEQDARRGG